MNYLCSFSTEDYKPVPVADKLIYLEFEVIQSFIEINFNKSYHYLLAKPVIKDNKVFWVPRLENNFKPLDQFSVRKKKELLEKYNATIYSILQKSQELELSNSNESRQWEFLIREVFNLKNNIVFSDGSEIVLVWGYQFNNEDENYIPFSQFEYLVNPQINEIPKDLSDSEILNTTNTTEEELLKPEEANLNNNNGYKSNQPKRIIVRSQNFVQNYRRKLSIVITWLFLILLLALIIWMLIPSPKCCNENMSDNNDRADLLNKILPANPTYRLPIDTTKVIQDDDGLGLIVSDRINIALKNKDQKLEDFSIDLVKAFNDSSYKIIYYDTATARLQLKFPEEKRPSIKDEIRNKLSSYQLLIWDESIFKTSKIFNDPSFSELDKSWYFNTVNAQKAWDISTGNPSIIIAVVDDGFDLNHPDLARKNIYPYNVRTHDKNVFANSSLQHGTHVAGTALANCNNNFGTSGIAPDCSFMPIQISDESNIFTCTDVVDGILYAIKHKADVINLSLGKQFSNKLAGVSASDQEEIAKSTFKDEELFWKELFELADKENVTIVLAAGNQNIIVGIDPIQRSENTIKVSAIDNHLIRADFSNYGAKSTISAPGVSIYNCIPQNQFDFLDGTSMAAPIVTGAVALMKSINPTLTNQEILKILLNSSKNIGLRDIGPLLQIDKALQNVPIYKIKQTNP